MLRILWLGFTCALIALASSAHAVHDDWSDRDWESDAHDPCVECDADRERRSDGDDHLAPFGLGPYVGLHFVVAPEAYRNGARKDVGGNRNVDGSYGFGARLGLRFHPHLAAELHSEWIEGFDLQQVPGDHSEIRTWTNTINGKFYIGHGRLQPYALAGVGLQRAWVRNPIPGGVNFDDVAFVGRVGAGLDLELTPHVALNLEGSYLAPTGDLEGYDTVSVGVGLKYRF